MVDPGPSRLSAGIVPVRMIDALPNVLLLRVYRYWDFPKGEVEVGEEPLASAVRELEEETGLVDVEFCWGQEHVSVLVGIVLVLLRVFNFVGEVGH